MAAPFSPDVQVREVDLGLQPWGRAVAVIVAPTWGANERFPLVVALHGRGEALKDPAEGAMGWPRDYAMVRAIDRLRAPPLTRADFESFVDDARLAQTNASLKQAPFRGVVVACPWMPDLDATSADEVALYARFVTDVLVPRVRGDAPAAVSPESTGIDGVSLGGAVALRIGLSRPDAFGAVGGIQPALSEGQAAEWTTLAQNARSKRPDLKLRLLTSRGDYFRSAISQVSDAWTARGIGHDFAEVPGPHDYIFNRGPGSIELLLWHDRVLQRA
ncbi:MAG TPA: alpha/beta hydrolase-fold protein [Polyangiaceae bacterium]|nr:alpha/beta hydrolase-fold protein [Polyangiaceae bacterium]